MIVLQSILQETWSSLLQINNRYLTAWMGMRQVSLSSLYTNMDGSVSQVVTLIQPGLMLKIIHFLKQSESSEKKSLTQFLLLYLAFTPRTIQEQEAKQPERC